MSRRDGVTPTGDQAPQRPSSRSYKRRSPDCFASRFIGRTRRAVRPSFLLPFNVALIGALLLVRWGGDLLGGHWSIPADRETAHAPLTSDENHWDENRPAVPPQESHRESVSDNPAGDTNHGDGQADGDDHSNDTTEEDGASGRRDDPSASTLVAALFTADDDYRTLRSFGVGSGSGASVPADLSASGSIPTGRLIFSGRDVVIPLARGPPAPTRTPDP